MDTGTGTGISISFAGTDFAYLPILSKVFRFTFLMISMLLLLHKSSPCLLTIGSAKVEVSLVSVKVKP